MLLSTPLALSIKERLPDAQIDYLVLKGTEGVLAKNPLVRSVYTIDPRKSSVALIALLWKKYDYAIGSNVSDRTTLFCAVAGRRSYGFSYFRGKEWWKKLLLTSCRLYDDRMHIVPLVLTRLEPLAIPPCPRVVVGGDADDEAFAARVQGDDRYVVLHPYSRKEYKCWTVDGWRRLSGLILEAGLRPLFTVSPNPDDAKMLADILAGAPLGTGALGDVLSFPKLAAVIRRGRGYVGVDTVVTHMAAALDVPTVALYGPTLVHHWGPWPNDFPGSAPYGPRGTIQRQGLIAVIQKEWECVPCNREECSRNDGGGIACMEAITPEEVMTELAGLLGRGSHS
ncbi:glycosyltransferase family 9 protein [Geobacter hydrogenophilus]|uniref:LPS core biosynthesis protein n=1 Tax=Geobacter hydrogenophilus TaxID=40983 RepID=A0A9W6LDA4_9BACT|nr:glycosyltransferase family 9 protein [Geobacter hydrogenophilus]MBT0892294.1 glycosyltransferase family 9 protein [Geobacter hydrogenophilus]GLI39687.1 LPS core biosynthesis protein [Geobacter hydrogenophilus]